MLVVRNLKISYGPTEVVRDVSFEVKAGEVVALLGANGAGKSSVLNALSGLVKPRGGSIKFVGTELAGRHPQDIVRAGMVQVPQGRQLWPRMSVKDNLKLGASLRSDTAGIQADLDMVYALFPVLKERQNRTGASLSGGEQQMAAIGRAILAKPKLLLLDEPSAGLSPLMVQTMMRAIRTLADGGLTVLLVEQNVGIAEELASSAFVLSNGEIVLNTPTAELSHNPKILEGYFGH